MGLSAAGGAGHLDPLLYPWDSPVASGVMQGNEFRPLELSVGLDEALAQARAAPLDARSLVVSIGSNSSADVMRRKFANYHQPVNAVLPLVRGQLHNIGVGHSAHVSKAGYIAAAPYPLLGECTAVWLAWLDDLQLLALDETEPNYRRIRLDGVACPLVAEHGDRPEEFSLFASRWGVLTDSDGGKLPFLDQPALFERLAGSGTGGFLEEGKSVFGGPPELVAERLATTAVQARAREWFSSAGLAAPVYFDGPYRA